MRSTADLLRQLLPSDVADDLTDRLLAHCCATGDELCDVVADALTLHLDELEGAELHGETAGAVEHAPPPDLFGGRAS